MPKTLSLGDLGPASPGLLPAQALPHSGEVGVRRLTREANISSYPDQKAELGSLSPHRNQNPPPPAFPERAARGDPSQRLVFTRRQRSPRRRGGAELQMSRRAQLEGHVAAAPVPPPSCQRCIWPKPRPWLPLGPCAEPRRPWRPGLRRSQGISVSVGIPRTDVVGREGVEGIRLQHGKGGRGTGPSSASPGLREPSGAERGGDWLLGETSSLFRVPNPVCGGVPRPRAGERRRGMNGR